MNPVERIKQSRWTWFLRGLPDLSRANALLAVREYTMTSFERCNHLWRETRQILDKKIPGAFVECGVWRGGSAGLMAMANREHGESREIHLFDSFEGLPEPTAIDGDFASKYSGGRIAGELKSIEKCKAGKEQVENFLFNRLSLDRTKIHLHAGWFQNTVPKDAAHLGRIAILRLDGDWYESTRICLEHLYPLLSPGGLIILDDYFAWEGCKKATDEYRAKQGISKPIIRIDADAACWNC